MSTSVAVVIPTYNSEKTILRAIESCENQVLQPKEIIVVDNNSTDSTPNLVSSYRGDIPVTLLSEDRQGANYCRNKGLNHISSDYVQFLDSDDELLTDKLAEDIVAIQRTNAAIAVSGFQRYRDSIRELIQLYHESSIFIELFKGHLGKTSCFLFSTSHLKNIGGWSENQKSSQEYELLFRAVKNDLKIVRCEKINVVIYEHGMNRISMIDQDQNAWRFYQLREEMLNWILLEQQFSENEMNVVLTSFYNSIVALSRFDYLKAKQVLSNNIERIRPHLGVRTKIHMLLHFKKW